MGRVSKYKKVKSIRGFGNAPAGAVWGFGDDGRRQKKRSARSETLRKQKLKRKRDVDNAPIDGFDLPPQGGDDFNLFDLSVRKQKREKLDKGLVDESRSASRCVIPENEKEAMKLARILKINKETKKEAKEFRGKMEGESKRAFNKRVETETRQLIQREALQSKNSEKREKRKQFLKNKKRKKKETAFESDEYLDSAETFGNVQTDGLVTGEMAAAAAAAATASPVVFGEQVERPPVFQQLPRGAVKRKPLNAKKGSATGMSESQVKAEHNAMEAMRRKVQAEYAIIKAKRRKAGDFHL